MKKGFTILEMLVASLLLGMLTAILTMMMNQSSITWRIGTAGVADLDEAREGLAEIRDEADNIYVWNGSMQRLTGLWNVETGNLRTRAWNVGSESSVSLGKLANAGLNDNSKPDDLSLVQAGSGDSGSGRRIKSYTVNVMSAGPNGIYEDNDDIWSFPDDIEM
ncbi:MAG: type II secretion system protein [Kiritimatiellae bacterium]|nr:type II secretion system protein [Kiritimatiellia bacterium]